MECFVSPQLKLLSPVNFEPSTKADKADNWLKPLKTPMCQNPLGSNWRVFYLASVQWDLMNQPCTLQNVNFSIVFQHINHPDFFILSEQRKMFSVDSVSSPGKWINSLHALLSWQRSLLSSVIFLLTLPHWDVLGHTVEGPPQGPALIFPKPCVQEVAASTGRLLKGKEHSHASQCYTS